MNKNKNNNSRRYITHAVLSWGKTLPKLIISTLIVTSVIILIITIRRRRRTGNYTYLDIETEEISFTLFIKLSKGRTISCLHFKLHRLFYYSTFASV